MTRWTLIPVPAMVVAIVVGFWSMSLRQLGAQLIMNVLTLLPILADAEIVAAAVDVAGIAVRGGWASHVGRLALHLVGLALAVVVLWQTVPFVFGRRGIDIHM